MKLMRSPALTASPVTLNGPEVPPLPKLPALNVPLLLLRSTNQLTPPEPTGSRSLKLKSILTSALMGLSQLTTTKFAGPGWISMAPFGQRKSGTLIKYASDPVWLTPAAGVRLPSSVQSPGSTGLNAFEGPYAGSSV